MYQNIVLIQNYLKYETVRKIDNRNIEGEMNTPDIVLCRDPPNYNKNSTLIHGDILLWKSEADIINGNVDIANISVKKLNTFHKVK